MLGEQATQQLLLLGSLLQIGKKQHIIFESTHYVHSIIIVETQYCDDSVLASANMCNKNETKIKSNPILILRFLP